jgi:hypothetical protein
VTPSKRHWYPVLTAGLTGTPKLPLDRNPDFAQMLGVIIEHWTWLEEQLCQSFAHLLDGNGPAARAIFYSLNATSVRIGMVRSVAREVMPEGPERTDFIWLLDRINDLSKKRNDYIHGEYHHSVKDQLELIVVRPANAEVVRSEYVTVAALKKHVENVDYCALALSIANEPDPKEWTADGEHFRAIEAYMRSIVTAKSQP